jgi:hypothetical protein
VGPRRGDSWSAPEWSTRTTSLGSGSLAGSCGTWSYSLQGAELVRRPGLGFSRIIPIRSPESASRSHARSAVQPPTRPVLPVTRRWIAERAYGHGRFSAAARCSKPASVDREAPQRLDRLTPVGLVTIMIRAVHRPRDETSIRRSGADRQHAERRSAEPLEGSCPACVQ